MDQWTLILTSVALTLGIWYFFFRKIGKLEEWGVIHMKPLPIIGNMAAAIFRKDPIVVVLDKIYKLNEEADYVGLYDFSEPVILLRSPELMKNIAIKNFDHFVDHRGFVDAVQDPLFGNNLFSLRGDKWKEIRNLLSPAFTGSKMKAMFKLMMNCGENFADYLAGRSTNEPNIFNSKDAFTRYTNDVIATCAFGISVDSMRNPKNDFYILGREATNLEGILSLKFFLLRSFPRISKFFNVKLIDKKIERFFEGIVRETIETRDRRGISRPDMIQLMMETRGKKSGEGPELTILDMTAQAFIFFFGGFDTSSTLMCFAAHQIAVNEDVQLRLMNEVDAVLKETNGEPTYDAVNGMQYLDAVINETLRIYPIAAFLDRMCVKRFEMPPALPGAKPVIIEPGQNVWFPVYSIHRNSKYYTEPNKFDPERFMGSRKNDIDPSHYFPFGQGPRICIGNRFALLETKVVLFQLLAKCHLKPAPQMIVPLELSTKSFAMTAKGGFWLQLKSRNTSMGKKSANEL